MDSSLKERREAAIRGHTGGTFAEVVALTSLLQLSHITYSSFLYACPALLKVNCTRITILRSLLDFTLNLIPLLLALTLLSSYIYHLLLLQLAIITINFTFYLRRHRLSLRHIKDIGNVSVQTPSTSTRVSYVSNMMSALLLATSLSILAVDFPLFDRRFAKTEMYGWSLMDVGVGGFIAINGALSPESRIPALTGQSSRTELILKSVKSTAPMLLLGLLRLVSLKALNYQEHLTEYGVHWNFFFTIAFSKLTSTLLCCLLPSRLNLFYLSISLALSYQYMLTYGGLTAFILGPDRSNLVAANKEGLLSTVGLVSLYLFFVQYGRTYLPPRKTLSEFGPFAVSIAIIASLAASLMYACHAYIEPVSRREANLAFLAFMVALLSTLVLIEIVYYVFRQALSAQFRRNRALLAKYPDPVSGVYESPIFEALGRAGLLMFLAANLLTGAVNLTFDTLAITSPGQTVAILLVYSALITIICLVLRRTLYRDRKVA